jgi:Ca2+-binding RTX toxin-like protein
MPYREMHRFALGFHWVPCPRAATLSAPATPETGMTTYTGSSGVDTFTGSVDDDIFDLSAGNNAAPNKDTASGLEGNDTFLMGTTFTQGDRLDGGTGDDTIVLSGTSSIVLAAQTMVNVEHLVVLAGGNYIFTVNDGTLSEGQNFTIDASALSVNFITFNGLAETTSAFTGTGGAGNDTFTGGAGDDIFTGGAGVDHLYGSSGNDVLHGGDGVDALYSVSGSPGTDLDDNDTIYGEGGADTIYFHSLSGLIDGGDALDIVYFDLSGGSAAIVWTFDPTPGLVNQITPTLAMVNVESLHELRLGSGDDVVSGGQSNIYGGAGNDHLESHGFTSQLYGEDGNDRLIAHTTNGSFLYGGNGDDVLTGGLVGDTLRGEDGNDTADYSAETLSVVAYLTTPFGQATIGGLGGVHADHLFSIENLTGGSGGDTLTGDDGANILQGSGGYDTLDGGAGDDTLNGGSGNDLLRGGAGNDSLVGGGDEDTADYSQDSVGVIIDLGTGIGTGAAIGTDSLADIDDVIGGSAADILTGDAGANLLDGRGGADQMHGAGGDDIMVVDNAGDSVSENIDDGTDLVRAFVQTFTLGPNVENLIFVGGGNCTGTGNGLANVITAAGGADTLDGAGGADTLIGGGGNDTYLVDQTDDVIVEFDNAGTDLVNSTAQNYTLSDNVENLTFVVLAAVPFHGTGNDLANVITGGHSSTNTLEGLGGDDTLWGGARADRLDGGSGNDTMTGGRGNDTYVIDSTDDHAIESAAEGTDTIETTLASFLLDTNFENLTYVGNGTFTGTGNAANNTIMGGRHSDQLDGAAGDDRLDGRSGRDTVSYETDTAGVSADLTLGTATGTQSGHDTLVSIEDLIGGSGNDILLGNAAINLLSGGDGKDILGDSTGKDTLIGGAGDDVYRVRDQRAEVIEASGAGHDRVETTLVRYGLGDNLEDLTFTGVGDFTGTGNTLDNFIVGGSGGDTLTGKDGNDILDGAGGIDVMVGGRGDDIYVFEDAGDFASEKAGDGHDIVEAGVLSCTLDANVEDLFLIVDGDFTGNGNGLANIIAGRGGNDTLKGLGGNDALYGEEGNDTLNGGDADDLLLGNEGDDHLSGDAGNDELKGMEGDDSLNGASGDDTLNGGYGDNSIDGGDGIDTVTYDDLTFDSYGMEVDLVSGTATVAPAYYGTDRHDTIVKVENVTGGGGDDILKGTSGKNVLIGGDYNDVLIGRGGGDTFDGGAGYDRMEGGAGRDSFYFHSAADSPANVYQDSIFDGDAVNNFNAGQDRFYLPSAVIAVDAHVTLDDYDHGGDAFMAATSALAAHHAVVVTMANTYPGQPTYLAIDQNGVTGFQVGEDLLIRLDHPAAIDSLSTANFFVV